MVARRPDNPFVFGSIIHQHGFVNRVRELDELIRDLEDCEKVFLLSPRRFGKSSLVALALLHLQKRSVKTVNITVSSFADYGKFLEKFAEETLKQAGTLDRVKNLAKRFWSHVQPEVSVKMDTGEWSLSFGQGPSTDPAPLAPEVFALPGELTKSGEFKMAICLDEFQHIAEFDSGSVEAAIRNEVQKQPNVGYVFAGSQPSLMKAMLKPKRPFYKAGPQMLLKKISADDWREFILRQFTKRQRSLHAEALDFLFEATNLIPFDVQRVAHELWDEAELRDIQQIRKEHIEAVVNLLVAKQETYFESQWQSLTNSQRGLLLTVAKQGSGKLLSADVRTRWRLGSASTVQRALEALQAKDILDFYEKHYFFLDPLFGRWVANLQG